MARDYKIDSSNQRWYHVGVNGPLFTRSYNTKYVEMIGPQILSGLVNSEIK